jgi:hypothetical protein
LSSSPSAPEGVPWAGPPLDWLPRPLREPRNLYASIAVGWLLTFPVSIALAGILHFILPNAQGPEFPVTGPLAIILLVIVSPMVETLLMAGALALLLRFMPPRWAVLASAAGWGAAHSIAAPVWGLIIWWPFLIFSTLYVTWRQRSLGLALAAPMITHALQNLPSAIFIAAGVQI